MRLIQSASRGVLRIAVAVTFVWVAGTDAYGAEACAHHDAVPGHGGTESHVPEGYIAAHSFDASHDGGSHTDHESDGPCTCITHCEAPGGKVSPSPLVSTSILESAVHVGLDRPVLRSAVLGPRHRLFELHLPNAPPHAT